ncbi:hypothetical protein FB451DRAFT_1466423, partial [Mycena latifolia]
WILAHEKYLGHAERCGADWRRGRVTLVDADAVFPTSVRHKLIRTITRPADLQGYEVLGCERQPKVHIQPSVAAFKAKFDTMSDGLLKNINWNNIFVAGEIVLGVLLAVATPAALPRSANQWKASDIDIYIHGLAPKEANEKIKHIFKTFRANLVVRNSKTITFYSKYPLRRIQVVLKLVKSPKSVLLNFDLDICAMGWDGSELWMLPRAARALETGFNVFTMNLIQGHYLSERRASQEQRVFKYAYKGYGIRTLPSYIASLKESRENVDKIARGEHLFDLDMEAIAEASRTWTTTVIKGYKRWQYFPGFKYSHCDLENVHQLSTEPQGRSCLTGFSLFMRHVALWEMEHRKEIILTQNLAYDDTPMYTWDQDFDVDEFQDSIDQYNRDQITKWLKPFHGQLPPDYEADRGPIEHACRLSHGYDIDSVLSPENDITMPLLLPLNFAAFANDLVGRAQAAAGLEVEKILTPAIPTDTKLHVAPDSENATFGLFMWHIGKELMWQQLDRRIDEVFEALYSFHRAHDRLQRDERETQIRLITQLSKRAIRTTVEDEFAAFARWIGRKP